MKKIDWSRPIKTVPSGHEATPFSVTLTEGQKIRCVAWHAPTRGIDWALQVDEYGCSLSEVLYYGVCRRKGERIVENVPPKLVQKTGYTTIKVPFVDAPDFHRLSKTIWRYQEMAEREASYSPGLAVAKVTWEEYE